MAMGKLTVGSGPWALARGPSYPGMALQGSCPIGSGSGGGCRFSDPELSFLPLIESPSLGLEWACPPSPKPNRPRNPQ